MDYAIEKIKIRQFEKRDADAVATIVFHAFKSKFQSLRSLPDDQIIQLFKESGFVEDQSFEGYLVAEKDGEVVGVMSLKWQDQKRIKPLKKVGFIKLCGYYGLINILRLNIIFAILKGTTSDGECYIEHIAVSSSYRGHGIGTMLMNYANEMVETSAMLDRTTLYVSADNISAIKLYQKLGFVVKKRESSWISQIFSKAKSWLYMVNTIKHKDNQSHYSMQNGWWLGFLGIIGFFYIPRAVLFLEGDLSPRVLLGLLWFLWLRLLIPQKK
jgi:ribosomal protein S18 acetylase RimI-like enzyme